MSKREYKKGSVYYIQVINIFKCIICIKYIYYNLLINIRLKNKRTNLGKIYFEKIYIIIISNIKANVTWFIK